MKKLFRITETGTYWVSMEIMADDEQDAYDRYQDDAKVVKRGHTCDEIFAEEVVK